MDNDCLLDMIRRNSVHKFLAYFPRWKLIVEPIRTKYFAMCSQIDSVYANIGNIKVWCFSSFETKFIIGQ